MEFVARTEPIGSEISIASGATSNALAAATRTYDRSIICPHCGRVGPQIGGQKGIKEEVEELVVREVEEVEDEVKCKLVLMLCRPMFLLTPCLTLRLNNRPL